MIEHDLSVGRYFYRRLPPLKVAVTTCGSLAAAVLLARARTSADIYAHSYPPERLIVNFAFNNEPIAAA